MTLAADTHVVTESLNINSAIRFGREYDLKYAITEAWILIVIGNTTQIYGLIAESEAYGTYEDGTTSLHTLDWNRPIRFIWEPISQLSLELAYAIPFIVFAARLALPTRIVGLRTRVLDEHVHRMIIFCQWSILSWDELTY